MKFKKYLSTTITLIPLVLPTRSVADTPTITYSQGQYQVQAPDWSRITWDNLEPVQQPGYLTIPQNLIRVFGYDPSRSWSAGQKVSSVVMLGDADDAFGMSSFSLKSISAIAPPNNNKLTLKDFGLMQWQTPNSLVKAIPSLGNLSLRQVPPIAALLSRNEVFSNLSISQILRSNPQAASLLLGKLDLSKYAIDSIPGLTKTPLNKFKSWQQSYVNQVPSLSQIPFSKMPKPIDLGIGVVGVASLVLGSSEHGYL